MNPHDEMRALTCHCGRIACRHHRTATDEEVNAVLPKVIAQWRKALDLLAER